MPVRIQRRRAKGWRLPSGAVCVTRPGLFGNIFRPGMGGTRSECVARFRAWLAGPEPVVGYGEMAGGCWLAHYNPRRAAVLARLPELRGKDLACYCPLDAVCHADVLLELANRPEGG